MFSLGGIVCGFLRVLLPTRVDTWGLSLGLGYCLRTWGWGLGWHLGTWDCDCDLAWYLRNGDEAGLGNVGRGGGGARDLRQTAWGQGQDRAGDLRRMAWGQGRDGPGDLRQTAWGQGRDGARESRWAPWRQDLSGCWWQRQNPLGGRRRRRNPLGGQPSNWTAGLEVCDWTAGSDDSAEQDACNRSWSEGWLLADLEADWKLADRETGWSSVIRRPSLSKIVSVSSWVFRVPTDICKTLICPGFQHPIQNCPGFHHN